MSFVLASESVYPMISVTDALSLISEHALPLETIKVPLINALGHCLAEDYKAITAFPPFRASVMDGYAVYAEDGACELDIVTAVTAGSSVSAIKLLRGQAVYITTGSPVPEGANAVVKIENTAMDMAQKKVKILEAVKVGTFIRQIGCDVSEGEVILKSGDIIRPAEIGMLATFGYSTVNVIRKPKIAVLSTGNELVDLLDHNILNSEKASSCIYDSNRPMLLAAIKDIGADAVDFGVVSDNESLLENTLLECSNSADIVITSGGVSMGSMDLVKPTVEKICNGLHFGRVCMKPGKPATFGSLVKQNGKETLYFALPGNPASALSCFHLFVVPAIYALSGRLNNSISKISVSLSTAVKCDNERPEYQRASLAFDYAKNQFVAVPTGVQASSRLMSMRNASVLVEIPQSNETLSIGSIRPATLVSTSIPYYINNVSDFPTSSKHVAACACCVSKADVQVSEQTDTVRVCVLVASDRCFKGESDDKILPLAKSFLLDQGWMFQDSCIVPDEVDAIQSKLRLWTEQKFPPNLILTCGGTGFSPRDITPEAVLPLIEKTAFGIQYSMMQHSLDKTPFAVLSRPVAGVCRNTLIMTLPGNPRALAEIMTPLVKILPHALKLLEGGIVH